MSGSALSPDIALSAGAGLSAAPLINPLDQMQKLQALQAQRIQLQTSSATLAARQRAGQIMAAAPDVETGVKAMSADPQIAGFTPEMPGEFARTASSITQNAGMKNDQSQGAFDAASKGLIGALNNPDQLHGIFQRQLGLLQPATRATIAPQLQSLEDSMLSGLPDAKAADSSGVPGSARANAFHARVVGVLGGFMGPDKIEEQLGAQRMVQQGDHQTLTQFAPPQGSGNTAPSGIVNQSPPLAAGLPPQVIDTPQAGGGTKQQVIGGAYGLPGGNVVPPNGSLTGAAGNGPSAPVAAPSGVTLGGKPNTLDQGQQASDADYITKTNAESGNLAKVAMDGVVRINNIQQSMADNKLDKGTSMHAALAGVMGTFKSLGANIDQDQIDAVAGGDLAAFQTFKTFMNSEGLRQLSQNIQGQGRTYLPEVQNALNAIGPDMDPRSILNYTNAAKNAYGAIYKQAEGWPKFREAMLTASRNGTEGPAPRISDYENYFNRTYNRGKDFPQDKPGGVDFAPMPLDAIKGAGRYAGTVSNINPTGGTPQAQTPTTSPAPSFSPQTQKLLQGLPPDMQQKIDQIKNSGMSPAAKGQAIIALDPKRFYDSKAGGTP